MRPLAPDIAAPEFPKGIEWVNVAFLRMEKLLGSSAALVHFWDLAQLNSLRTLPYVRAWHDSYRALGLRVVGVHSPRHTFGRDPGQVRRAVQRLDIEHAVAIDSDHEIWHDYGCEGWPSLFLWSNAGALVHFHQGEGDYAATEHAIREALLEISPAVALPRFTEPLRPTDASGTLVAGPTAEILPGGSVDQPLVAGPDGHVVEVEYEAAAAHAVVEGSGTMTVRTGEGEMVELEVTDPGLYPLAEHGDHSGRHRLELELAPGQRLYAISFAAGLPARG